MANELNAPLGISNTGLTVIGRVRASGGVQEGSDATMTETGVTGFYSGSFALGAVSDGEYSVEFIDTVSGNLVGAGELSVKNNAEYELHDQNDFDPATEAVANVTLVATTTTNTDMRGTEGANTTTPNTIAPDNAGITANGVAIGNLNDFDSASETVTTDTASRNASKATGFTEVSDLSGLATEVNATGNKDAIIAHGDLTWTTGACIANVNIVSVNGVATVGVADFHADVSSTATEINATSNKNEILAASGGGGETKEDIYTYFTDAGRQNTFRADIVNLESKIQADARQTTLIGEHDTTQALVTQRPTNPVLSTDTRLNNLDAAVSSRSTFDSSSEEVTTDTASRDASKATGFTKPSDLAPLQ